MTAVDPSIGTRLLNAVTAANSRGNIHDKGMLILAGYLRNRFGQKINRKSRVGLGPRSRPKGMFKPLWKPINFAPTPRGGV
jgi:hypothetical protein